jgi:hypothetical protein
VERFRCADKDDAALSKADFSFFTVAAWGFRPASIRTIAILSAPLDIGDVKDGVIFFFASQR